MVRIVSQVARFAFEQHTGLIKASKVVETFEVRLVPNGDEDIAYYRGRPTDSIWTTYYGSYNALGMFVDV